MGVGESLVSSLDPISEQAVKGKMIQLRTSKIVFEKWLFMRWIVVVPFLGGKWGEHL